MTIPDKIKAFLSEVEDISFGWSEIAFIEPERFAEEQIGFSVDPNGKSLIGNDTGNWKEGWLVIATDELGDPIIVDINTPAFAVYTSAHDEEGWDPLLIASSLDNFKKTISILEFVAEQRANPEELEDNPLTEPERQQVLKKIEQLSPDAEMWYWEQFLEDE